MMVKIMYGLISEDYLMHHGVKGMKWGIRHNPDRVGRMRQGSNSGQQNSSRKANAKKWLKRGAVAAGVILGVSAGVYLAKSGKGQHLVNVGKKFIQSKMGSTPKPEPETAKVDTVLKELNKQITSINGTSKIQRTKVNTVEVPKTKVGSVEIPKTKVNTTSVTNKKLDDPSNFTWKAANRVSSDGKVSSVLLPTDKKRYADAFAKEMSKGKPSDYDYWHRYIMSRMR